MSDMQKHLLPEWRREIARLQTENEALRARVEALRQVLAGGTGEGGCECLKLLTDLCNKYPGCYVSKQS